MINSNDQFSKRQSAALISMVLLVLVPSGSFSPSDKALLFGEYQVLIICLLSLVGGAFAGFIVQPKHKTLNTLCGIICSIGITFCASAYLEFTDTKKINKLALYGIMLLGILPSLIVYSLILKNKNKIKTTRAKT